jgi:NAD(P)-dependent dehydrogenase (short-subunit alcohol dehydrogenase family)
MSGAPGIAVIAGAGPGLGLALAARAERAGLEVHTLARDSARLQKHLRARGLTTVQAHACDLGDASAVRAAFADITRRTAPELVVFNAGGFLRGRVHELNPTEVEATIRIGALAGLHVAQAAMVSLRPARRGTLIFTGATASLRGSAQFAAFAMSKFALRALAQSLARELGPEGIHVAHVIIDGQIGADAPTTKLDPDAIAEAYWQIHQQGPSAWTHELDLRPATERF